MAKFIVKNDNSIKCELIEQKSDAKIISPVLSKREKRIKKSRWPGYLMTYLKLATLLPV